jgi:hypothetical protein
MSLPVAEQQKLANEAGYEAFRLIVKRMEAIGDAPFSEIFQAVTLASEVCLANAIRPAIERAEDRASLADSLTTLPAKHVRALVEPAVKG